MKTGVKLKQLPKREILDLEDEAYTYYSARGR